MSDRAPQVVVMGVSGAGKSTIGALVADTLGVPFADGDALHPPANIAKMAAGIPLTDDDRRPWLRRIGQELAGAASVGLVVACSALKRAYRDAIRAEAPAAIFLHLTGSKKVLARRMEGRIDHFMPTSLLDSQLATLEPLQPDEHGIVVDIAAPVDRVVADAVAGIRAGSAFGVGRVDRPAPVPQVCMCPRRGGNGCTLWEQGRASGSMSD